jgi:hypothetical protein
MDRLGADAGARAIVRASEALADLTSPYAGLDANPVMLQEDGAVAADAVVLRLWRASRSGSYRCSKVEL